MGEMLIQSCLWFGYGLHQTIYSTDKTPLTSHIKLSEPSSSYPQNILSEIENSRLLKMLSDCPVVYYDENYDENQNKTDLIGADYSLRDVFQNFTKYLLE